MEACVRMAGIKMQPAKETLKETDPVKRHVYLQSLWQRRHKQYPQLEQAYESKLLSKQETEIKQLIDLMNQNERIVLVCFEADHNFCHRHTLIEHLQKNKSIKRAVIHL